jgi:pilus assembly protein Flp/PilA
MPKILGLLKKFNNDEDGAALIEYTVLLGVLLVAVIAVILAVGGWVGSQWAALNVSI